MFAEPAPLAVPLEILSAIEECSLFFPSSVSRERSCREARSGRGRFTCGAAPTSFDVVPPSVPRLRGTLEEVLECCTSLSGETDRSEE